MADPRPAAYPSSRRASRRRAGLDPWRVVAPLAITRRVTTSVAGRLGHSTREHVTAASHPCPTPRLTMVTPPRARSLGSSSTTNPADPSDPTPALPSITLRRWSVRWMRMAARPPGPQDPSMAGIRPAPWTRSAASLGTLRMLAQDPTAAPSTKVADLLKVDTTSKAATRPLNMGSLPPILAITAVTHRHACLNKAALGRPLRGPHSQ